jgi:hypothetical protein
MKNGDIAGLAVFQDPYAYIGVKRAGRVKYIIMVNNGTSIDSVEIDNSTIYLRAQADYGTSLASFSYSFDNESFQLFGNKLNMRFNLSVFTGNKFCLFNFATIAIGGFVDFDWFRTDMNIQTDVIPEEDLPSHDIPGTFFLGQNYPNPFNPSTVINYQLKVGSDVQLKVYDLLGTEVAILVNEFKPAGNYSVRLSDFSAQQSSGVYFYTLKAGNPLLGSGQVFIQSKKMILIK